MVLWYFHFAVNFYKQAVKPQMRRHVLAILPMAHKYDKYELNIDKKGKVQNLNCYSHDSKQTISKGQNPGWPIYLSRLASILG